MSVRYIIVCDDCLEVAKYESRTSVAHARQSAPPGWTNPRNMGCDCNRALEWNRAGGIELEDAALACSVGAFTAIEAVLSDGRRIPIDTDRP